MSAASIGSASATASRPSCSCRPGRSCTRTSGRCRCRTSRATSAWSPSTRAATAGPSAPPGRPRTPRPSTPRTRSPSWTRRTPSRPSSCRSRWAPSALSCSRTPTPSEYSGSPSSRPRFRSCPSTRCAGTTPGAFSANSTPTKAGRRYNASYWRRDYPSFLQFFFETAFSEPHSTKQIEDAVGWGLETDPETLIATALGEGLDEQTTRAIAERVSCPVMVIHGEEDGIRPVAGRSGARRPDRRRVHADAGRRALPAGAQARRREPGPT